MKIFLFSLMKRNWVTHVDDFQTLLVYYFNFRKFSLQCYTHKFINYFSFIIYSRYIFQLITWNSFSYFLLLYSFHIIYQYHKIDTSVIYEDIKAHKLCCSLLDYFHQKYELHWSLHKCMIKMITIQKSWYVRPKELLVRSPNKSTNWFELIHLPHNFVKKFLSVTNKSKFLSTLRSITIIWLRWNIHDVLLPFVFVLTFFRASSAKEKHVASAFLQSTKPKLSQLFDIFDTKATKKTETTISTSACRFSTRKTYA